MRVGRCPRSCRRAAEVALVYDRYEKLKRRRALRRFRRSRFPAGAAARNQRGHPANLQADYDHVLVDEYQDVNRSSVRLLAASAARRPESLGGRRRQAVDLSVSWRLIIQHGPLRNRGFSGRRAGALEAKLPLGAGDRRAFSAFATEMKAGGGGGGVAAARDRGGHPPEHRAVATPAQRNRGAGRRDRGDAHCRCALSRSSRAVHRQ